MLFCLFQRGSIDHKPNSQTASCATCGGAVPKHRVLGLGTSMVSGVQVQSIQAVTVDRCDEHELERLGVRPRGPSTHACGQQRLGPLADDSSEEDNHEFEKVGGAHSLV